MTDKEQNLLQVPRLSSLQFASMGRASELEVDDITETGEMGEMGYQQTLMYGRYTRDLGEQLRTELKRQKMLEKTRKKELKRIKADLRYVECFS